MIDTTDRLATGIHAKALLDDELLNAVFDTIADKYRQAFENAPRGDIETMRVAHASLAALKDLQGALRAHLGAAKMYEADLEARELRTRIKSAY